MMRAAPGFGLSLALVRLRGQKRTHYVAQVTVKPIATWPWSEVSQWQAETTVCGRTGWRADAGWEPLRFCGACHAGVEHAWDAAPPGWVVPLQTEDDHDA